MNIKKEDVRESVIINEGSAANHGSRGFTSKEVRYHCVFW